MAGKIAVAVVHGIGMQEPGFEEAFRDMVHQYCCDTHGQDVIADIEIRGVHWAHVVDEAQQLLNQELREKAPVKASFPWSRHKLLTFAGDAIAYRSGGGWVYDKVHQVFAQTLRDLAEATDPNAPLVIIAHSLGTIIASNYLYDLEYDAEKDYPLIQKRTHEAMGDTPLEWGKTLSYLFTLGSPISMFSIVHEPPDRGIPVTVPSRHSIYKPSQFPRDAGWYNYYDKHDIIGFPIGPLSKAYEDAIVMDEEIPVGGPVTGRTPLAHTAYFDSKDIVYRIGSRILALLRAVESGQIPVGR